MAHSLGGGAIWWHVVEKSSEFSILGQYYDSLTITMLFNILRPSCHHGRTGAVFLCLILINSQAFLHQVKQGVLQFFLASG